MPTDADGFGGMVDRDSETAPGRLEWARNRTRVRSRAASTQTRIAARMLATRSRKVGSAGTAWPMSQS